VLLAILDGDPMNGYEILGELGRLFGPAYRPSPGSVYPALQALLEEKLIAADKAGRKQYSVTKTGSTALEKRAVMLTAIELRTGVHLRGDDGLAPALDRFNARVLALSGRVDTARIDELLEETAMRIEQLDADDKEQR
jgi:DNA-binding PadR family transcriptional regulator